MASIQAGLQSQEKLCAYMRQPLLEELVRRIYSKILRDDCLNEIETLNDSNLINDLVINTVFKKSKEVRNPPDYYILIEFIVNGVTLGHITFHLVYDNCQRIHTNSLFHIKNNQSKRRVRRLYIKEDAELANCIVIYFGDIVMRPHNINDNLYKLSKCAVDVINFYLQSSQQHQLSLENRRANNVKLDEQTQHYINDIIKLNARCVRGGKRSTRRRPRKVRNTTLRGHGLR